MLNPLNLLACYMSVDDKTSTPTPEYIASDPAQNMAAAGAALDAYIEAHGLHTVEELKNNLVAQVIVFYFREGMKAGARLQLQLLEGPDAQSRAVAGV